MIGKPSESIVPVRSASPNLPMMHSGLPSTSSQAPTSTTSDVEEQNSASLGNLLFSPGEQPRRKLKAQLTDAGVPRVCQVCNDCASGFHYGVWSCEGCKAFYKRSIQGPVDYVCPATNDCTIDKHRRKSCQACRLRKCNEVGMNKASQRKERKKSSPGLNSTPKGKRNRSDSGESAVNSTSGSNGQSPTKCLRTDNVECFVSSLVRADLPILQSCHNHNIMPSRVHLLNSLAKLADRELVYLINWAKHIPGYTDLSLSDQVHLIECSWMELLLLNCAFQSMDQNGASLLFAPDLLLDRIHWNIIGMVDILEQVAAVAEQMAQYDIHKEELLLLKAAALVNAEVKRLSSYSQLQEMQQTVVDALLETAQKHHPNNSRHVPSILLLLSHIRQAGAKSISYFCQLQSEGSITFGDLLNEMLEAQAPVDKKPVISNNHEPPSAF